MNNDNINNSKEFKMITDLLKGFIDPKASLLFRLNYTKPDEFDKVFDEIIAELQEQEDIETIEDIIMRKEELRTQCNMFYEYNMLDKEKEARTSRSYFNEEIKQAQHLQLTLTPASQLYGDIQYIIIMLQHISALIEKGNLARDTKIIYKHLYVHLLDVAEDLMCLAQSQNTPFPIEIAQAIQDLSLENNRDFNKLCEKYGAVLMNGFAFS